MKPTTRNAITLLTNQPGRSVRSISLESGASRRTVGRKRNVLASILAKEAGTTLSDAAKAVVVAHYTRRKRARPDFQVIDDALDRGESLRSVHRRYRAEHGKNALSFGQFAHVCRAQRGGTSLKCVRRNHTHASVSAHELRGPHVPRTAPLAVPLSAASPTEGRA